MDGKDSYYKKWQAENRDKLHACQERYRQNLDKIGMKVNSKDFVILYVEKNAIEYICRVESSRTARETENIRLRFGSFLDGLATAGFRFAFKEVYIVPICGFEEWLDTQPRERKLRIIKEVGEERMFKIQRKAKKTAKESDASICTDVIVETPEFAEAGFAEDDGELPAWMEDDGYYTLEELYTIGKQRKSKESIRNWLKYHLQNLPTKRENFGGHRIRYKISKQEMIQLKLFLINSPNQRDLHSAICNSSYVDLNFLTCALNTSSDVIIRFAGQEKIKTVLSATGEVESRCVSSDTADVIRQHFKPKMEITAPSPSACNEEYVEVSALAQQLHVTITAIKRKVKAEEYVRISPYPLGRKTLHISKALADSITQYFMRKNENFSDSKLNYTVNDGSYVSVQHLAKRMGVSSGFVRSKVHKSQMVKIKDSAERAATLHIPLAIADKIENLIHNKENLQELVGDPTPEMEYVGVFDLANRLKISPQMIKKLAGEANCVMMKSDSSLFPTLHIPKDIAEAIENNLPRK